MPAPEIIKAVAVTAELCGRIFSPEAARVFVDDLGGFDDDAILKALQRCRREVRGALTVQDVVSRIDDGRPGPDEAWAMLPFDESVTVVWTAEMSSAWGVAIKLYDAGDRIGARQAFKEAYLANVNAARDGRVKPKWTPSLGHSAHGRESVLLEAVEKGRLTVTHAQALLPHLRDTGQFDRLLGSAKALAVIEKIKGMP